MPEITPRKVIQISRRKFIIVILVIVVILLGFWLQSKSRPTYFGRSDEKISIPQFGGGNSDIAYPSPGYNGQPTVNDTREFLKVNYSGEIETRNVSDTVKRVKGAVREAEGRIDSEQTSKKYGHVRFVIPKSNFEEFRSEVESITHAKLYTESVSSQNLLGQKQIIEQQQASATATLARLEQEKKNLDTEYTNRISTLNRQLASTQAQLSNVRYKQTQTDDQSEYVALQSDEYNLIQQETNLKESIAFENRNYTSRSNMYASQINYAKQNVAAVDKQDTQFTNNIETVEGYVSVRWISLWEIAKVFSPIHPTLIIIIVIVGLIFFLNRRGYIPKIEFV
jgi:hypothetical protein